MGKQTRIIAKGLLLLLGAAGTTTVGGLHLQNGFGSQTRTRTRRYFVASVATATITLVLPPAPSSATGSDEATTRTPPPSSDLYRPRDESSSSSSSLVSKLLSTIPVMNSGAPATNATIPGEVSRKIEDLVASMEQQRTSVQHVQSNNAQSTLLQGSWRLLYSNAPEIVSLSKGLPLGFELGPTYQPLDTANGFFENRAKVDHPYKLAALQTIVVGTIAPSAKGSVNAAGVVNTDNNRVDIKFEVIAFQLDTVLGKTLGTPIRKTLVPKDSNQGAATGSSAALPANDQTYLDERLRVVRGGDGSLFVFSRAGGGDGDGDSSSSSSSSVPPMMTVSERAEIIASSTTAGSSISTPVGEDLENEKQQTNFNSASKIPAEIRYLFRDRKR